MLETNSEKAFAGVIIVVALLLAYLLMTMPTPTAEGYCTNQCESSVAYSNDPYVDSSLLCGCENGIVKVEQNYDTTHNYDFKIFCKCCVCVGSSDLELPECEGPFGFLFRMLGRCI
jgi:hypothetical protein